MTNLSRKFLQCYFNNLIARGQNYNLIIKIVFLIINIKYRALSDFNWVIPRSISLKTAYCSSIPTRNRTWINSLAYHYSFHCQSLNIIFISKGTFINNVDCLWSGLYLNHIKIYLHFISTKKTQAQSYFPYCYIST